jgi:2-polyprenyl-3-methyl-5-hydroxy-6-metoxy-1,4-benzoquinol methylase
MSSSDSALRGSADAGDRAPPCPACGAVTTVRFRRIYDDRYGYPGYFQMNGCRACGHLHVGQAFEPRHLTRLYSQFYPRARMTLEDFVPFAETSGLRSWWNGDRASAFRWVPRHVRVLDIGCGFGQTLEYHQRRGCEVYGVEADENIRRVAERFGFKVHVGLFDPTLYEPGYFDYVTLDQVVEHSTDPLSLLKGVARVLKPGGTVIASTPNPASLTARILGKYWLHWHVPYHLQFYTTRSMSALAAKAGLELERTCTATSSEWLYYQELHFFAFPYPGVRSGFWAPDPERRFFERKIHRILSFLHRMRFNHAASRVLDALGVGDNRLYFLRKPAG